MELITTDNGFSSLYLGDRFLRAVQYARNLHVENRKGTFEHMGCQKFESDERRDYLETRAGKKAMERFQGAEDELRLARKWNRRNT